MVDWYIVTMVKFVGSLFEVVEIWGQVSDLDSFPTWEASFILYHW